MVSDSVRLHALKALTTLSKFLGIYSDFRRLMKNHGLKCSSRNTDKLIIDRLTKSVNPDEIFNWIRKVKGCMPELGAFMDFVAITGLRYIEAVESNNLMIKLENKGNLDEYFDDDRLILEHFKFKETFIRNSKKVFISFVPTELVSRISRGELLDYDKTKKRVARRVGRLRFADTRELHASIMTKHLRQPEIDFLQGRVSSSVFMRNYFNPLWIKDLKSRAFSGIEKALKSIS